MKNLNILSILFAGLMVFASCDKGDLGPVMNSETGSPAITAPESGASYTLQEDAKDDTLVTFEWSNPDYGFSAAPDIKIEMDNAGNNFANPKEFATTTGTSYSLTVGDMNSTMLGLGFTPLQEASLEFRVTATIADTSTEKISEPITVNITPYSTCRQCPEIYVPGSYQAASGYTNNWSPADAPALTTVDLTDNYEGYVYMANGGNQFKFTADRNWSLNWGDDGADGTLDQNGTNISVADAGYYKINVDLNSMTFETLNTDWGVIGSATANGWDSDQDMTYNPSSRVWSITADLSEGEIKFRANDDWALNYGDNAGDGTLERDGSNIAIDAAGNYTIELDLSSSPYSYSVTQN
jgi:hypothetical protein